jgi:OmpA-OmpF porin, OOP family
MSKGVARDGAVHNFSAVAARTPASLAYDRGMPASRLIALGAAMCALAAAPLARADGLDAERFVPAVGDQGTFVVEHPAVPAHLGWTLGLFLDYADDPLVVALDNGTIASRPVSTAFSANLTASLGLFRWVELGIGLPLHLVYEGDTYTAGAARLAASSGLGDIRLVPKIALLRKGDLDNHVLLGVAFPVSLPSGDDEAARGAGGVTVTPELLFALHLDRIGVGFDAGYRWRSHHPADLPWGDEIVLAPWLSFGVTDALSLRAELLAEKEVSAKVTSNSDFPVELLGGLDYAIGDWDLFAGASRGLSHGIGDPDVRIIGGVRYSHHAERRQGFDDRDRDGVMDKDDACPDEEEDQDGFEDDDGCPEPDNDHDGVPDDEDECPELSGDRAHDGCPAKTFVKIDQGKVYIFGKVQFRSGKAQIDPRSEPLLDQIGEALKANPQVEHVRIEGHTDNVGGTRLNQKLSEERADAVKEALVKRGVDGDRLTTRGLGESRPLAPNKTAAGRAKNRRVEFFIAGGGK